MNFKTFCISLTALLVLFSTACTQNNEKEVVRSLPPQKIEQSIQTTQDEGLRIQKDALGKLFLLRATVKILKSSPNWEDLKPMLVTFEKSGDRLGMFEMDTYSTYKVVDSKRLVTQFNITRETDKEITFEWGDGLKLVARPFYDDPEDKDDTSAKEHRQGMDPSIEIVSSFTKSTDIRDNQLHVRQALRARASFVKMKAQDTRKSDEKTPSLETRELALEVDSVLKPYSVNPRFQPKEADSLRRVGFFQTSTGIDHKSESKAIYASHWDLSPEAGPITFALSKHFPPEVLSAVREGILYWNLVLGAEKIHVIENFDPESDFPDRTVVVNWLPWEDAGASWANFQTDPLTGEILRGQIHLTSVFLQISKVYPESESQDVLSLEGMSSSRACRFPVQALQIPAGTNNKMKKEFILDQLRHVVAHEAGHTMGLRHNFAGSMDSALNVSEINVEKKKYEIDPNHQGAALSSTIMDYIRGLEEGMIGRWIKYKPLGYDVDALSWVNSAHPEVNTKFAFCTDDDISKANENKQALYGCERFDAPANPFNIRAEEVQRISSQIIQIKFDSLLNSLYPENSDKVLELETILNQDYQSTYASLIASRNSSVTALLSMVMPYLYSVSGGDNAKSTVYFENQVKSRWDSESVSLNEVLKAHLLAVGGIAPLFKAILPMDAKGEYDPFFAANQLKALKESGRLAKGVTSGGRRYELSETQQTRIEKYLQKGIDTFDASLIGTIMAFKPYTDKDVTENGKTIKETKTVLSGIGQEQWFPEFAKLLKSLILAQKDLKTEKLGDKEISYRVNAFASYYRKTLVEMMLPSLWQASLFPKPEIAETKAALMARLAALYQQLEMGGDLAAPTTDVVAEHEAFLGKLSSQGKIPSLISALANEDIEVLKELDKIK